MSCSRVSRVSKLTTKSVVVGGCSLVSSIFYIPYITPDKGTSQVPHPTIRAAITLLPPPPQTTTHSIHNLWQPDIIMLLGLPAQQPVADDTAVKQKSRMPGRCGTIDSDGQLTLSSLVAPPTLAHSTLSGRRLYPNSILQEVTVQQVNAKGCRKLLQCQPIYAHAYTHHGERTYPMP